MSKITNDGLTRSGTGTGCFRAVAICQQWASKVKLKSERNENHNTTTQLLSGSFGQAQTWQLAA